MARQRIQPDICDVYVSGCDEGKLTSWPFPVVNGERLAQSQAILGKKLPKQKPTPETDEEALL
jgi:hypothetical protein